MSERDPQENVPRPGLLSALRELTDGLDELIRSQIALLRVEAAREASAAWENSAPLIVATMGAFLGYGLLLCTFILVAGALGGLTWMAGTALVLAVLHLGPGLFTIVRQLRELEVQRDRIESKAASLTGDQPWENQLPANSPPEGTDHSPRRETETTSRKTSDG